MPGPSTQATIPQAKSALNVANNQGNQVNLDTLNVKKVQLTKQTETIGTKPKFTFKKYVDEMSQDKGLEPPKSNFQLTLSLGKSPPPPPDPQGLK